MAYSMKEKKVDLRELESQIQGQLRQLFHDSDGFKAPWVSLTMPIQRDHFALLQNLAGNCPQGDACFYWRDRSGETELLGLGAAKTLVATGSDRFRALAEELHHVHLQMHATDPVATRWFGGYSFAVGTHEEPWQNWPDAKLVLPQFSLEKASDHCRLTVNWRLDGRDEAGEVVREVIAAYAGWFDRVADARLTHQAIPDDTHSALGAAAEEAHKLRVVETVADIQAGKYEKLVLARRADAVFAGQPELNEAIARLTTDYPDSFVFSIWQQGDCFLGASPEQLVKVTGERVNIDCLAGTTRRGATREQDDLLGMELLGSAKNREEHEVVLRWLHSRVTDLLQAVEAQSIPVLLKLANVQHLHTPVSGQLMEGRTLFDLVERLHPTPAVAGVPRDAVLPVIRQREEIDRGWYAGAVGWTNAAGDGTFAVALRSALVQPGAAHLFAGGGIMGDSDPQSEWLETELKLKPMRMALGIQAEGDT